MPRHRYNRVGYTIILMLTWILVLVKAYEALFPAIKWLMYDLCEEQRESRARKAEGGVSLTRKASTSGNEDFET